MKFSLCILLGLVYSFQLNAQHIVKLTPVPQKEKVITVGAERTQLYFQQLKEKKIAVVANQTSLIGKTNLVDSLLSSKLQLVKIFSLEHGFRGKKDAGAIVENHLDEKTQLPIVSLYAKKKKPTKEDLSGVDVVIYDIQDVGVRFYTYISSLQYIMESCAENHVELIILDRPNPNGFYIDGPVLEKENVSFVGMNQIPIVYGMTCGEYARMINDEGWLKDGVKCKLNVIELQNYHHADTYQLNVFPSPNLSSMSSVYLYPTLCLFEGTAISVGRGTNKPFQQFGHPKLKKYEDQFTPKSTKGASIHPLYEDTLCYGYDVSIFGSTFMKEMKQINLFWMLEVYKDFPDKKHFFNSFFPKLAGNNVLQQQIMKGMKEEDIRETWKEGIDRFKKIRKKYLLYPDFE